MKCFDSAIELKANSEKLEYQQLVMQFNICNPDTASNCKSLEDSQFFMSGKKFLLVSNARVITGFKYDHFRVEDSTESPFVTEDTMRLHWSNFNTKVPTKHVYRTHQDELIQLFSSPNAQTVEESKSLLEQMKFYDKDVIEELEFNGVSRQEGPYHAQEVIIERDMGVIRYYA